MKHWRRHRIIAMLLLVAMLVGSIPATAAFAADGSAAVGGSEDTYGGRTAAEILQLIGGKSYQNYVSSNSGQTAANDDSEIIIDCSDPSNIVHGKEQGVEDSDNELGDANDPKDDRTNSKFVIADSFYDKRGNVITAKDENGNDYVVKGVYTPASGKTTFRVHISESGMYSIDLKYLPIEVFDYDQDGDNDQVSTKTTIERMFFIDGKLPFNECRYLYIPRCWEYISTNGVDEIYRDAEGVEEAKPKRGKDESDESYAAKLKDYYLKCADKGTAEPREEYYATAEEYEAAMIKWATMNKGGAVQYDWDKDIQNNDIRPERREKTELRTYFLRDWLGYTVEPFQFYLEEGDHYFTFEATREPLVISEIRVYGYKQEDTYEYQLQRWLEGGYKVYEGKKTYKIEAESPVKVSDQVLFPGTDRTSSINSPSHPSDLLYNIANSNTVGQYMTYRVYVEEAGLYNIMARFRQNTMAGMFTSRRIRINGEIQFKEASYLRFNYDTSFQNELLGNKEDGAYLFYLKQGWNDIEVEVVLGDMSKYVYDIANVISMLTNCYQTILQITGTNPDTGRDYSFGSLIPDVIVDLGRSATMLNNIYETLVEITGETGQHVATLDTIRRLVADMAMDEYEIAPNFLSFKNYLTALSNWLYTSLSQPLKLDYLLIQSPKVETPSAKAGFFYAIGHEAKAFIASFFKDYNVIGFKTDDESKKYSGTILMWNTESREDALIKRTMIDSGFTPNTNIAVNIRYVAQGLQESVLAGVGPDVANMASGTAVSWGIRNAVADLSAVKKDGTEKYEGFRKLCPIYTEDLVYEYTEEAKDAEGNTITIPRKETQVKGEFVIPHYTEYKDPETGDAKGKFMNKQGTVDVQFSHAALEAVSLDNKTYLIPTNMNFEMSFYRVDVFAKYGLKPPRTWQELQEVIPKLTTQRMTMGMQTSLAGYQMILYQNEQTMYANDYTSFNDSKEAIAAFGFLCDLFNEYSLPISYDLTRFRTGEIPIVVANWTTYNTFMGYYELRGLWTMESLIGWEHGRDLDGDGDIDVVDYVDRSSILDLSGIVIPKGSDDPQAVWKYIKWYTDFDAQSSLARLNLADQANTTVKFNTANLNALLNQAWTDDEEESMREQIPHLKGLPFNPGDYNISRYINFAFLAVYNSNANPDDQFTNYVVDINKELDRKREEYHLPTSADWAKAHPETVE